MVRSFCLVLLFLLSISIFTNGVCGEESEHVLVVCPQYFRESLQPWIEHRSKQGYTIHVLTEPRVREIPGGNGTGFHTAPELIRSQIREANKTHPLKHLLIIGCSANGEILRSGRSVPSKEIEAKVIQDFGEERFIPSDAYYADLDDDGIPDLTHGRIPVRTKEELEASVRKIIRYEKSPKNGLSIRKMNFIAGIGGFSKMIDSAIEGTARHILDETIPGGYELDMTQASWKSPYCPDPYYFRAETIRRLSENSFFWVYIGHGQADFLDALATPLGYFPIFLDGDSQYVKCKDIPPIAVFLACHVGAVDHEKVSLAESLVVKEDGPIASIAPNRTSMPYAMAVFAIEMIEELFKEENGDSIKTLGEIVLAGKRNMMLDKTDAKINSKHRSIRNSLDSLAKMLDPSSDRLTEQKSDHLHLFQLLGDPLLRVPLARGIEISAPKEAKAGEKLTFSCRTPIRGGTVFAELAVPRTRQTVSSPHRPECVLDEMQRREIHNTYVKANTRSIVGRKSVTETGEFEVSLDIPPEIKGEHSIRIFVQGEHEHSLGSAKITVR